MLSIIEAMALVWPLVAKDEKEATVLPVKFSKPV
jgi:hypothetical protein